MNAARSSALHQRNRLLLHTVPLRTPAQSRRVLTTSIPVASPSSSSPSSGHGHGHGKAFNSSLAVDSIGIAGSNPAEFASINQFETSQTFCFEVTDLDSGTDYRRIPHVLSHVYYHPLTPENKAEIDKIFNSLTCPTPTAALQDPVVENRPITTWGRTLHVPLSIVYIADLPFINTQTHSNMHLQIHLFYIVTASLTRI
ncbi:hypothetical protein DEU56DRAFT_176997 [Suillus clintonianus]|uniref:uncharacterized protein n=1 Tax=Suillus clintonianus TaxID=1904413 RepID=UPI001B86EAAE|nr:uncharacterized protein DEU56DRAFT_176997 [Suillus clintonianus]KAG2115440.1 hypothetical protein DEU56DRAFT_176997 [Suillus clintonianus]